MVKKRNESIIRLNPNLQVIISNDSIWSHYDELDLLGISISQQGQADFFDKIPKVFFLTNRTIHKILDICIQNKISKIGLTPWMGGNYTTFLKTLKNYNEEYPKEITLFHLNMNDYKEIKRIYS